MVASYFGSPKPDGTLYHLEKEAHNAMPILLLEIRTCSSYCLLTKCKEAHIAVTTDAMASLL